MNDRILAMFLFKIKGKPITKFERKNTKILEI